MTVSINQHGLTLDVQYDDAYCGYSIDRPHIIIQIQLFNATLGGYQAQAGDFILSPWNKACCLYGYGNSGAETSFSAAIYGLNG